MEEGKVLDGGPVDADDNNSNDAPCLLLIISRGFVIVFDIS